MTEFNRANGGAAVIAAFEKLDGLPYVYGGDEADANVDGTDCSGAVQWAYAQIGVSLPRTTEEQYFLYQVNDRALPSFPGDLLFVAGDPVDPNPGHVVMYVSPGVVLEAEETGTVIGKFPFDTDAWEFRTRPVAALPPPPPPVPVPAPAPLPALPPAKGTPPASALKKAGLTLLTSHEDAVSALQKGFELWYWASTHFVAQRDGEPTDTKLYVNSKFFV